MHSNESVLSTEEHLIILIYHTTGHLHCINKGKWSSVGNAGKNTMYVTDMTPELLE